MVVMVVVIVGVCGGDGGGDGGSLWWKFVVVMVGVWVVLVERVWW